MVNFQSGYRSLMWQAKQITALPQSISLDPTLMYPSNEGPMDQTLKCSGVFFKFNVSPTSFDLDPYFFFEENDYSITARAGVSTDLNHKKAPVGSGSHSVQPMVWKGPFYLSGWGYDICGLPVPVSGNDARVFDPATSLDRAKWKTGPVDLRWDDDRKVWTGGPEVIEGKMLTALTPGNFEAPSIGSGIIYRGRNLTYSTYTLVQNNEGIIKPNPFGEMAVGGKTYSGIKEVVEIVNRNSKVSLQPGDYFSAVKINYEWRILGAGGGGGCIVGKFKKLNCSSPTAQKTTVPPFILRKRNDSQYGTTYEMAFTNIGTRKVYYFQTDKMFLKDLIPSDSAGGKVASSNGIVDITQLNNNIRVPYSGYFAVVAFNNCEKSSNVYTYSFPGPDQYVDGIAPYTLVNTKTLDKLFDCPDSSDNFGIVTDDATGAEFYATHPFKFIKHDVRVIACQSNLKITCNNTDISAYAITEVDDCANAGTGLSRE